MKKKLLSITASILLFVQGAPVLADSAVFDDIDSSYAKDAIKELQGLGMVNGVSDTAFAPTSMITRQDFAILIAKALQLDVTKPPSTATFKDIPVSHYAFPYVEALVRAKVFQGREQNIFGVGEMLTREQLAVVLVRGKQLLSTSRDTNLPFEDRNEISDWAKADVQTVHEAGLMVGDGTYFAPKRAVERQELALVVSRLLHLADHSAVVSGVIESITDGAVTINQHTYAKGETVKGLLGQSNAPILIGAVVSFETEGASVTKITSLELHKDGQAVEGDEKEFSRNLVLDGQGYMMDGNMDVKADYITVQNLQVSGNFRIGDELKNDFYGKNLQVKGTTIVDGGSSHTVVFDNSALEKVEINKTEVRVEPSGSTSVNEIVINSNAVVTADAGVTIPKLTVNDGAAHVEINANVASLNLQSSQDSVVSGTGNMGTVTVSGSAGVTFQTTGTITKVEITNKDAKVTLPAGVKIQSLVLPDGAAAADLIANYSAVSGQISSVTSASGQAVAGSTSSSKSSSSKQARGTVTGNVYYGTANKPLANASVTLQGLNVTTAADGSFVFADVLSGAGQSLSVTADGFAPNPYTAVIDIVSGQTTAVPAIVLTSSTNHAPVVIQAIPKQTIALNGSGVVFNLSERIQDEDGDALKFTVVSLSPKVAKVELNGSELKVTPVATGTAIINITANDGRGKTISSLFNVTVTAAAVNHDPKLEASGIPDQSASANGAEISLDLTQSFSDEDGDALTFQAASSNEGSVAANVYGNWLRLKPLQAGASTVTVKAEDGKGGKADASFVMNVTAVPAVNHDPKAAKSIPDQTGVEQGTAVEYELSGTFTDEDGDVLTLSAVSSDLSVATVKVMGTKLEVTPLAVGTSHITVKAEDGKGGKADASFVMNVTAAPAVNHDPKAAKSIPDQTGVEQGTAVEYELNGTFTDEDGDVLTLSAVSSDLSVATVKVTGTKLEVTPLAVGTSHITVKAEDGKGGKADASFVMNVTAAPAVNHKPELQTIPDQTLQIGGSAKELDLSAYLQDPDGDPLTVSAAVQNPSIGTVAVTGNKLTLSPVGVGQTVINVSVDDLRGGTATGMIQLKVESVPAMNHNPEVVSSISTQVLTSTVTNDRTYDLSQLFSDADGDTLQYTVTSDLPDAVNASVSGSTLKLSPGAQAGSAKITVTANDSRGGTESYAFTVRNAPLAANGFVIYRTKQGVSDFSYDLSAFFPNQSSFEVYKGTPDSTLSGPATKNGKIISLANDGTYTWVIGSDGKAVVIQVIVEPQGTPELFFSEYLDGGDGRIAVELYYKGDGDPNHKAVGYQIEVYQWMTKTNTMKVTSKSLFDSYPGVPYIFIDTIFYDAFDITNISYYNDELDLYNPTEYNTVALVLKKDGQIVDVLGDPSSHDPFMPTGGTIVRKQGIYTGSKAFTGQGEWVTYPKGTFQYLGTHSL